MKKTDKEQGNISLKQYDKLLTALFKRIKADERCFKKLSGSLDILTRDIDFKNKRWEVAEKNYMNAIDVFDNKLTEFVKSNKEFKKANTELAKNNFELTRAYNSLAQIGKFAEENGIDIKKHTKQLPESGKYDFKQEHKLMESGKVNSTYTLTPKKKKNENS